jgi:hypothetical protein
MRTATAGVALAAALIIVSVPGCGSSEPPSGASSPASSGVSPPASPAAASPASPATRSPASPAPTPSETGSTRMPKPTPTSASPSDDGPDRTGDLVRGRRTLKGEVERSGGWVLLRTDDGVWALLGRRGAALSTGATATVTGIPATPPAGCPVDRALTVYSAR